MSKEKPEVLEHSRSKIQVHFCPKRHVVKQVGNCLFFNLNKYKVMFLKFTWMLPQKKRRQYLKTLLIMKLIAIFIFAAGLQVSATGFGQRITLSQNNVPLKNVFKEIVVQSGYQFFYKDRLLKKSSNVSLNVTDATVEEVLNICFKNQALSYTISDRIIVVKEKRESPFKHDEIEKIVPEEKFNVITGTVKDAQANPLQGVSIVVRGTQKGTSTNESGYFSIDANPGEVLDLTIVGFKKRSITVGSSTSLNIVMEIEEAVGEEVIVVGYGTQQKKNVTGAIATVKVGEISQDVSGNVSSALQGRVVS